MQFDPLSDAFVRIYNAEQAGHYEVSINPASKLLESMLTIMQSSGYVGEFERILIIHVIFDSIIQKSFQLSFL